jgi:hypothetical protein
MADGRPTFCYAAVDVWAEHDVALLLREPSVIGEAQMRMWEGWTASRLQRCLGAG